MGRGGAVVEEEERRQITVMEGEALEWERECGRKENENFSQCEEEVLHTRQVSRERERSKFGRRRRGGGGGKQKE